MQIACAASTKQRRPSTLHLSTPLCTMSSKQIFECQTLPYHLSRRAKHLTMHALREARAVPGPPFWRNTPSQSGIPRGADCHDGESDDTRAHNTLCRLNQLDPFTVCTHASYTTRT